MKKCNSCFRYCENNRDARKKGLKPRELGFADYHYKPRRNVMAQCIALGRFDKNIKKESIACKHYKSRVCHNFQIWWRWHFVKFFANCYRIYIRVPIGARRARIAIGMEDYYDVTCDKIVSNGKPICPHCGEYPYSEEQCVFCGQRFL